MEPISNGLTKNRFFAPILDSLSWNQLYLFIVLLGVLPSVADQSLFRFPWEAFSQMDFLFSNHSLHEKILYLLPAVFLPIGLFICFKKKNLWMIIGLLPAIFGLVVKGLFEYQPEIISREDLSIILFILYKIAFLYFVFKCRVRSISFAGIVILMIALWVSSPTDQSVVLTFLQVISFVFLTILFRTIYLVITQNLYLFTTLERKEMM